MKIYTKTGDSGETGLFGGARVRKDDCRVEAYGAVDEACASIGLAVSLAADERLKAVLLSLQADLFVVGADLATPATTDANTSGANTSRVPRIADSHILRLETLIDRHEAELAPLTTFILPGGTRTAAALHVARTVARRAERRVVSLHAIEGDDTIGPALRYMNRLADLLFVLARVANAREAVQDIPWKPVANG